jgi:hypothetical protein
MTDRDFKLLVREYFLSRDIANCSRVAGLKIDVKIKTEAVLREAEAERKIRAIISEFTKNEIEQLPF